MIQQKRSKTGGRKAGTANRVTKDLRLSVKTFLERNIETLQDDFDSMEALQRLLFIEKLLKYAIPVQSQQKIDFENLSEAEINQIINSLNI